ncbi:hypothetical protein M0Q50_06980 [bacterium]|jgi:hypothetical protein|nr:hypothetical protein [bacterium]
MLKKKTNDLTIKPKKKEKLIKLCISKFIDTKFRDYAVYVLESRGIPNFYDALTPVQRYILKNAPTSFNKTLTLVGKSIADGYHHGDSALSHAINKLTRPFGNAMQILEGDGFFGTEVSPAPAAARYTSVRISPLINTIFNKYKYLTTREPEGPYDPLWMDVPIGLVSPIVGIAVGYKATILPRKLKDIQDYLLGNRKSVKPYFDGFNGKIEKFKDLTNAWLISSNLIIENNKILIREIPPIIRYESILKKLDFLINKYENCIRIINNSNVKVNIDIIYTGKNKNEFDEIQKFLEKMFSIIVTESIIFIKDGNVLIYDSIEQYLDDYKWQIIRLKYKNIEYEKNKLDDDLNFNKVKEKFIEFILQKKRSNEELDNWLKLYNKNITERIEALVSRKFTIDELKLTKELIKTLTNQLKDKENELLISKKIYEDYTDPTLLRGIQSKKVSVNLFDTDDITEDISGIAIWNGNDIYDENDNELTNDDE